MSHEILQVSIPDPRSESYKAYIRDMYASLPLYLRKLGYRGKKQTVDLATVKFMNDQAFKNNEIPVTNIDQVLSSYIPQEWEDVVPDIALYPDQVHYDSVHGAEHSAIVGLYVEMVGQAFGLPPEQRKVLKRVAYIHDLCRKRDDDPDTGHGDRAAIWFETNASERFRSEFSQEERKVISEVSRYHDLSWEKVVANVPPENLHLHMILRVADALERYRLDKEEWQPKADMMEYPDNAMLHNFLLFAKSFSIRVRLKRLTEGLSIEEVLRQESISAGLIK